MLTTPQLIKDKEFESKFRGFDPIEVKEYLESLADEFFELQEKCKEQETELASVSEERKSSEEYSSSLETDIEFTRKISAELKDGCTQKEEKLKELIAEVEELHLRIADMEQENADHEEELSAVEARRKEAVEALKEVKTETEILNNKIEVLREQNSDLKKEEIDFKATLATAQRFAEDLKAKSRKEAGELKVKSTKAADDLRARSTLEAEAMIQDAENEITRIRDDAQAELERLPKEIEILENKKYEVKAELKAILENYLETIDVFYPDELRVEENNKDLSVQGEDLLFQKIEINDDGTMNPEDTAKLAASDERHMTAHEQDNKVLDSLLRGDSQEADELSMKDMFNLDNESS